MLRLDVQPLQDPARVVVCGGEDAVAQWWTVIMEFVFTRVVRRVAVLPVALALVK